MKNDAVINPVAGKKSPLIGPVAVMAATSADIRLLCSAFHMKDADRKNIIVTDLWVSHEGVAVAGPFTGAPHAAMILENLIVCGAQKIIFIGWCGTISNEIDTGRIFLPEKAWSDEGTSRHYGESDSDIPFKVSENLLSSLKTEFISSGVEFSSGDIWTTDAIYRETREKILYYKNKGVSCVEMELSALIAVSRFRGTELISVQIVSDDLSSFEWKPGFGSKEFKKNRKEAAQIVASFSRRMACLE